MFIATLTAVALAGTAPTSTNTAAASSGDTATIEKERDPLAEKLDQAVRLVSRGKSAESIPILDEIIAAEENGHKDEKRMMFAARTLTETLIYTSIAAEQNKSAVVFDDTWASAYWLKGFAMVDVGRGEEAKVYFDKAVALAPMNSQYLAERGEWFKSRKDWANAYRDFETASTAAAFSPDNGKSFEQRRAWRGMAFVRTEQGRLDEAEKLLRKCLELDPSDDNAKHELGYIASLRQKPN